MPPNRSDGPEPAPDSITEQPTQIIQLPVPSESDEDDEEPGEEAEGSDASKDADGPARD